MKRDIDLLNIKKALEVSAQQSVNKNLPFQSRTLGELEAKDIRICEGIRKGTARLRIFKNA